MSFAIFKTGGKQYKVRASEILKIEKLVNLEGKKLVNLEGKKIEFNEILAYGNKENIELGSPIIKGAKIEAELLKNSKERTVLVFKKRRRKNSRKKYGHRQPISLIRITKIFSKSGKIIAQAGPQKQVTGKTVAADKARKNQILEAKKTKLIEKQKIKKSLKKIETKEKKISSNIEKKAMKKKPLMKKKK